MSVLMMRFRLSAGRSSALMFPHGNESIIRLQETILTRKKESADNFTTLRLISLHIFVVLALSESKLALSTRTQEIF